MAEIPTNVLLIPALYRLGENGIKVTHVVNLKLVFTD